MDRAIHIGKVISWTLADRNISIEFLANKVDVPERILSLMLKNDDLGCNILYRISHALDYDFFRYYSTQLTKANSTQRKTQNLQVETI
ncbi:MAG: hypothetical protein WCL00_05340 [Bacteroidota bacterium]